MLTPAQARRANAVDGTGLNLLSPIIGWLPEVACDPELLRRVKAKLLEALVAMHAGYKLKRFLQEIYGEAEMSRGAAVDATTFTDYAEHRGGDAAPPEERTYLLGVEQDTIAESSTLWQLLLYTPPIIFFTRHEQEVAQLTLMGLTDPQIAAALMVSPSTVPKRRHAAPRRMPPCGCLISPRPQATGKSRPRRGEASLSPELRQV